MRKIFTFILALIAGAGTLFAESGTCGANLTWDLTGGVLTISGTGAMTDWDNVDEVPWYSTKSSIQSVVIENGVTSIGKNAFRGCTNLTSVSLPNTVTSIGASAFMNCSALTSINLPGSLKTIGTSTFLAAGLTYVHIPNSVASIPFSAFQNCADLHSVSIGYAVTSIGKYAFENCSNLAIINCNAAIPPTWGEDCFYDVPTDITVWVWKGQKTAYTAPGSPWNYFDDIKESGMLMGKCGAEGDSTNLVWDLTEDGILTISGAGKMADWNSGEPSWQAYNVPIKTLIVENGPTSIGMYAFKDSTNLKSVTIGNAVETIESRAFNGCTGLTSLTLGDGLTDIRGYAFMGCENLKSVTLPNSLTRIRECAFRASGLTAIVIPNNVTHIDNQAFYACSAMTSLTIGNSVANIGNNAFKNCSGLESITCQRITPPSCGNTCFDGITNTIPVYVPNGTVTDYKNDAKWSYFTNIQGADLPTGIDEVTVPDNGQITNDQSPMTNHQSPMTNKFFRDGQLFILRDGKVYTVTGQEVK
ncbi:MAG: leucine-rich repeat domain-containing protein [Paludibacteraceae bacterium]|nr:leucine-rich repeat domain-containing protein [Paludibacteraceae bacterium]